MFLLDTDTLIYFFRGQGRVAEHLLATAPADVAVGAITIYEIDTGIARSSDPAKRRRQLTQLLDSVNVLAFDRAAAARAADVRVTLERKGQPIGPLDTLIAGTALAHRATLVTHNTREFRRVPGLALGDWY
ncbi:MAG: hypothetical protein AMXMBFR8_22180 [Nevskiales bacterium]